MPHTAGQASSGTRLDKPGNRPRQPGLTPAVFADSCRAKLPLQPGRDFLGPAGGVFALALAAKMDALAAPLAEFAFERVGVRSFQSNAGVPE